MRRKPLRSTRRRHVRSTHSFALRELPNLRRFESLESRALLATTTTTGLPTWMEEGPGSIHPATGPDVGEFPFGGAVSSIAAHPFDPNITFLGTVAGGVWRSTDAGVTWTPLTDQFPSLSISALTISTHDRLGNAVNAVTPVGDLVLYAGTGSFSSQGVGGLAVGVLRSGDGGNTWSLKTSAEMAGLKVTGVVATREGANDVVLVSTQAKVGRVRNSEGESEAKLFRNGGIFRSTNAGVTWTKQTLMTPPTQVRDVDFDEPPGSVMDLAADPGSAGRIYASVRGAGVFRSTDYGANWTAINTGLEIADSVDNDGNGVIDDVGEKAAGAARIVLAVQNDPASATNSVYAALLGPPSQVHLMGVFRLDDGAAAWTQLGSAAPAPSASMKNVRTQGIASTGSPQMTFADGTPDEIRRSAGSWTTDGFQADDIIEIEKTVFNDGAYLIATLASATVLQLTDRQDVRNEGPVSNVVVRRRPEITLTDSGGAIADTITRSEGSWVADGFANGDVISILNSSGNSQFFTVDIVTPLVLTLIASDTLTPPPAADNLNGTGRLQVVRTPKITVTPGATVKLTRSEGSWGQDGIQIGHRITLGGRSANAGRSLVVTAISDPTDANPERVLLATPIGAALTAENAVGGITVSAVLVESNAATTITPQVNPGNQGEKHFSMAADAAGNVFIGGDTHAPGAGVVFGNLHWWNITTSRWQSIVGANANNTAPHADSRAIIFSGNSILEGNDGGIYRLTSPTTAARQWSSLNHTLRASEIVSSSYDTLNNVIFAGFQDNGNAEQPSPNNTVDDDGDGAPDEDDEKLFWRTIITGNTGPGDGNNTAFVPIDSNGDGKFDQALRFTGTNDLPSFATRRFDAQGRVINVDAAGAVLSTTGHDNLLLLRGALSDTHTVASINTSNSGSSANSLRIPAHGLNTGDGPFSLNSTNGRVSRNYTNANDGFNGNFLTGDNESYFVVRVNANRIRLARTRADATAASPITIDLTGAGSGTITLTRRLSGLDATDRAIFSDGYRTPPFTVNAVDNTRMLLGLSSLYASANLATGANPARYDRLDTVQRIHHPTPVPGNSSLFGAVAYGGWKGANAEPNVVYAARGNQIHIAFPDPTDNTKLGTFIEERIYEAIHVTSIVLDPNDYETAFAVAENGVYMRTAASAQTIEPWVLISQRMNNPNPMSVEFTRQAGHGVLLVGGANGVWRAIDPVPGVAWSELGTNLPNAVVSSLEFVPRTPGEYVNPRSLNRDDLLLVGTLGRGAWTVVDVDTILPTPGLIRIQGTNADDNVILKRNADNPSLLEVEVNAGPPLVVPLRSVQKIEFIGDDGNDTLTVDSTNGAISVPEGIHFQGGTDNGAGNQDALLLKGKKVHNVDTETNGGTTKVTVEDTRLGDTEVIFYDGNVETYDDTLLEQASALEKIGDALGRFFRWLAFWMDETDPGAGASVELALIRGTLPRALGGASPGGRDPIGDPNQPVQPPAAEEKEAESAGEGLGFLRMIEEGANGFSLADIGSLFDFNELVSRLDDLDDTLGNVVLTDNIPGVLQRIDARIVQRLSGGTTVNIDKGPIKIQGEAEFGADVDLHLVFGIDVNGFFIETGAGKTSLSIGNLDIDGDIEAEGNFGFLEVELENAELQIDSSVALVASMNSAGGKLRLADLASALVDPSEVAGLATLDILNSGGAVDDVVLGVDVGVAAIMPGDDAPFELGEAHVEMTWNDITSPTTFDVSFTTAAAQKLQDFLDFASNGADQIVSGLTSLRDQLNLVRAEGLDIRVPLLESRIDDLINFISAMDERVIEPLSGGVSGSVNFTSVQDLARQLARKAGVDPEELGLNYDPSSGELTYHIHLDHAFDTGGGSIGLSLGDEESGLSLVANVEGDLVPDVTLDFDFGVDVDGLLAGGSLTQNFFVKDLSFVAGVELDVTSLNAAARLGFIDIQVVNGTAVANPRFAFTLSDPGTDANDGRVSLKEIIDNLDNLSSLLPAPTVTGSALVRLPIGVNFGPISIAANDPTTTIVISIPDFADPTNVDVTFPDILKNAGLPDFKNLTAAQFVSLLGVLRDQLQRLSDTSFFTDLHLPLVDGAIDKTLDFTSSITNGLLYDVGADKKKDGPDRLAVDLNAALANANLASAIVVQSNGTKLRFEVIDRTVTGFKVEPSADNAGGFATLNFAAGANTFAMSHEAIPIASILAGNAGLQFTLQRVGLPDEVVKVILTSDATTNNASIGDDAIKLLRADNSATFETVQGLAFRLNTILGLSDVVTYNAADDSLNINIGALLPRASVDLPLPIDFDLDLGPVGGIQSNTLVNVHAEAGLNPDFIIGVYLGEDVPGAIADMTSTTKLVDLNDGQGVDIKIAPAITAPGSVDKIYGRLQNDAHFSLSGTIGGNVADGGFTVPAATTAGNLTTSDLAADINASLAVSSIRSTPVNTFALANSVALTVTIAATSYSVLLDKTATSTNTSLADLAADLANALKVADGGLVDLTLAPHFISVTSDGSVVVFTRGGTGVAEFKISANDISSSQALGISMSPRSGQRMNDAITAVAIGNRVGFVASPSVTDLRLVTTKPDSTFTDLGFQESMVASGPLVGSPVDNPVLEFGDAKFRLTISGTTYDVVVPQSTTSTNTTLAHLATDVNTALASAKIAGTSTVVNLTSKVAVETVGGVLQMKIVDGSVMSATLTSKIDDPTVLELGWSDEVIFTLPLILATKDVPLVAGRLTNDTQLTFSIDAGAPIPVVVYADDTSSNTSVLSLVADVNQAMWSPSVKTGTLASITPVGPLNFSVGLNGGASTAVTVTAAALIGNATLSDLVKDLNDALKVAGLGDHVIAKPSGSQFAPRIRFDGSTKSVVRMEITASAGNALQLPTSTVATSLAGRISADSTGNQLILSAIDSLVLEGTSVGSFQLAANAEFQITVSGIEPNTQQTIKVTKDSTTTNARIEDLVRDINMALANVYDGRLRAEVNGSNVRLRSLDPAITGFTVNTGAAVLGISAGSATSSSIAAWSLAVGADAASLGLNVGTTNADNVDFEIRVSNPSIPGQVVRVSLTKDANANVQSIINAIHAATSDVEVVINASNTGFTLIDKTFQPVALDSNGSLVSNNNARTFSVTPVNGSSAAIDLGLVGVDSIGEANLDGKIDGRTISGVKLTDRFFIENASLSAELDVTAPLGVNATANFGFVSIDLSGDASLSADLSIGLKDPSSGSGTAADDGRISLTEFLGGISDISTLIDAPSLTGLGQLDLSVDVTGVPFLSLNANAGVGFDVNLGDAFGRWEDSVSLAGSNPVRFDDQTIRLTGDFTDDFLTGARVTIDTFTAFVDDVTFNTGTNTTTVTLLNNSVTPTTLPVSLTGMTIGTPDVPDSEFHHTNLDDLLSFNSVDFSFASIIDTLLAVSDFLTQFDTFNGLLNSPIPLIDLSVHDLLDFADRFSDALTKIQNDPAGSLQLLDQKISEAFGVDPAGNLLDFSLDGNGTPTDRSDDVLKLQLNLGAAFSKSVNVRIPDLNLDALGGIVDFGGSATLGVEAGASFQLDVGVSLANPTDLFFYNSSSLAGSLALSGSELAFKAALGPLNLSVNEGAASIAGLITGSFVGAPFVNGRAPLSIGTLGSIFEAFAITLTGTVDATLPIYFPTESHHVGDLTLGGNLEDIVNGLVVKTDASAPQADMIVLDVSNVIDNLTSSLTNLSLLDQILFIVDGVDVVLGGVQDALDGEIMGFSMPLIGDSLADGAHVIGDFRTGFLNDFRSEVEKLAQPDAAGIKELLFKLLGGNKGLLIATDANGDALKNPDGSFKAGTLDDIHAFSNLDTATDVEDAEIWWQVKIGQNLLNTGADIGLDFGIPGLGLETEGEIRLDIDWQLNLGFGLSGRDGFFFFVDNLAGAAVGAPEMLLNANVTLPNASLTGTLGFLEFTALNEDVDGNDSDGNTHLAASFAIDINNSSDPTDDRLGLSEVGRMGFDVLVGAEAAVELGMTLGISDDDGGFPEIQADFQLDWSIDGDPNVAGVQMVSLFNPPTNFDFGRSIQDGLQLVEFKNVSLDVGSYISDVVRPLVEKIQEVTSPVQPIIDIVTTPLPVLSQLGLEITLLDIAKQTGAVDPRFIDAVETIAEVIKIINSIELPEDGSLLVPFGSFTIYDRNESIFAGFGDLGSGNFDLDDFASKALDPNGPFGNLIAGLPAGLQDVLGEVSGVAGDLLSGLAEAGGAGGTKKPFSFPIIEDPSQVFGMLMGTPAVLVAYDMPPLDFDAEFSAFFSIFGPLGVSINLEADLHIDFSFGYDTKGFTDFADSDFKNPLLLVNGLYVSDDPEDPLYSGGGEDPPELTFDGGLWAAAELNLGIARGGVGGGIFIGVDFNLFDNDRDGRIRLDELIGNFLNQLKAPNEAERFLAPLAIFDVTGQVTAELFAFLKIDFGFFTLNKTFDITPPMVLADFEVDFFRPPILASETSDGDLIINVGEFAAQRKLGDMTDFGEHIFIEDAGPGKVAIWSDNLEDAGANAKQIYNVSRRIIASSGQGDDIIDLSGVHANIEFEIDGGSGNDRLTGGDGGGVIYGRAGDDTISGGAGDDLIFGNEGGDSIHGGPGQDLLLGDNGEFSEGFDLTLNRHGFVRGLVSLSDGTDGLYGEGGDDILIGSGGVDTADGGDDNDLLIGDGGLLTFHSPPVVTDTEADPGSFGDILSGGAHNDTIYGGAGNDTINGNAGNDIVYGGSGSDTIRAGIDNDFVFGDFGVFRTIVGVLTPIATVGGESDTIFGDEGNDRIASGGGNDTVHGGTGDDSLWGGVGVDTLYGDANHDRLYGESDPDKLFGGDGNDYLEGGHGNDTSLGEAGIDTLVGGYGSDAMDGGVGPDRYRISSRGGTTDQLTTAYDSGPLGESDTMTVTGTRFDDTFLLRAMSDYYYNKYYPTLPAVQKALEDAFKDPIINDPLGFGDLPLALSPVATVLTGFLPTNGQLAEDVNFEITDGPKRGRGALLAADTADFDSIEDVVTALQNAVNSALLALQADGSNSTTTITVSNDNGKAAFVASAADLTIQGNANLTALTKAVSKAYTFNQMFDVPAGMVDALAAQYDTNAHNLNAMKAAIGPFYIESAEAYFFAAAKTIVDKASVSPATKRTQLKSLITDAYSPASVPGGMFAAIDAADMNDLSAVESAIDAHYAPLVLSKTGFIALLNNGGQNVERFNYRSMEALTVNTIHGNDYVVLDDATGSVTVNMGLGNDRAQVGQVFQSPRVGDFDELITGIRPEDAFATLAITRGWLSNGISISSTINGGDGADEFIVFHNVAVLNLNGGDGDDVFTIRAFALAGSIDSQRARTDIKGDGGADTILYVVNAPVNIDGGNGFDTVRIVGTEFSDDFMVTDYGVFGAGLNVNYVNVEKLVADGAEGNDRFFIQSTGIDVVTELDGGLGSDTFFAGGTPQSGPVPVVSNDLKGYSGIILHNVESTDETWLGTKADGISANIVDDEISHIIVTQSGGLSRVTEGATSDGDGWQYDSYTVRLSRPPAAGLEAIINVVVAELSPETLALGVKDLQFLKPGTDENNPANWVDYTLLPALEFTSAGANAWNLPQTVKFRAIDDSVAEGTRFAYISHNSDTSTDPGFAQAQALSVKVQINDNDDAGVLVTPSDLASTTLEGGFSTKHFLQLTRVPTAPVTVTLSLLNNTIAISSADPRFNAAAKTLTFTAANFANPVTLDIHAVDDNVIQGFHTDYIRYTVSSTDVDVPLARASYLVDGDFDADGVQEIPSDKATAFAFLVDMPDLNHPITVLYDEDGTGGPGGDVALPVFDPSSISQQSDEVLRYLITGNTLTFYRNALEVEVSGAVHISYSYTRRGYHLLSVKDSVVDIYDNDTPMVVVRQTNGSTDTIENDLGADSYTIELSKAPAAGKTVTIHIDSVDTRTTIGSTGKANFQKHVLVDGVLSKTITFNSNDWNSPRTVSVTPINNGLVDGDDTQVFAPELQTTHKIRGPLILEGAAGSGSLSLPAPLMMPGERNVRPSDGQVISFTKGTGGGATEYMNVLASDLDAKLVDFAGSNPPMESVFDYVGKTIELTEGPGTGVILDVNRSRDLFNRFWLINEVNDIGGGLLRLKLQNPSAVDPSRETVIAPTSATKFAITSLSVNFFADERNSIDYMMLFNNDSVASEVGSLTSSTGKVVAFEAINATTDKMTVSTAALQAMLTLPLVNDVPNLDALIGRAMDITVGPGVSRSWTIQSFVDGPIAGTKVLTLTKVAGVGTPTDRSEFRIAGGDTRGRITGFGMGPNVLIGSGIQSGGITYGDLEVVQANLGQGNDLVQVDYTTNAEDHTTRRTGDFYTLTMLNLGGGDDQVDVTLADGQDGDLSLNLGDGDDEANAANSSLPLTIFGWTGDDTITAGSGRDTIFGDLGQVDYINGDAGRVPGINLGTIVTRLGFFEPLNPVNPRGTSATATTLTDTQNSFYQGHAFPVEYGGLTGLVVQAISPQGFVQFRTIVSNSIDTLTIDRAWDNIPVFDNPNPDLNWNYRISTLPEDQTDGRFRGPRSIVSVFESLGGNDQISGNSGDDVVIGGAGSDILHGNDGSDWIIGDNGQFTLAPVVGQDGATEYSVFETIHFAHGSNDTLYGDHGADYLIGGTSNDNLDGGNDADVLLGDQAKIQFTSGKLTHVDSLGSSGNDFLNGGAQSDLIIGSLGDDALSGLGGDDLLIGDDAEVDYGLGDGTTMTQIDTNSLNPASGGMDTAYGGDNEDVVIGGAGNDRLDGSSDRDLVFGDNVTLVRHAGSGNAIDPRFRALTGTVMYDADGVPQVASEFNSAIQPVPGGRPTWADWTITLDQTLIASRFGDDYLAGGASDDELFGQRGNDTLLGDGTIGPLLGTLPSTFSLPSMVFALAGGGNLTVTAPTNTWASRLADGSLVVDPSFETTWDGDDYLEGNAGDDRLFGNLGQDDLVGGSSNLFSLSTPALRGDGADFLFGGAGTDISRNHLGDGTLNGTNTIVTTPTGHARDADTILGDNGNLFRLVGINGNHGGSYLSFNYDNYGPLKIVPRVASLLDYTPGGPDYDATSAANDLGSADELHGESGDDALYGMVGGDTLFGDGQDDDLLGGYGADWISGGTGMDGVIGDDGRISTSRNGLTGEPLYAVSGFTSGQLNLFISTPGKIQQATINVADVLKKTVNITPFNLTPVGQFDDPLFVPLGANDIIYGGLGDDFLHGAAGDDAMSGAEALPGFFAAPSNSGNVLQFGNHTRAGEFLAYDEFAPMAQIQNFLLNFDPTEMDGNDNLFGALGNDWIVGGQNRDHLYGGYGNDLLDADDDKSTNGGLNNAPDGPQATMEDIAYGGAGRDVLIGNTGGDRLIDWTGEFNSYVVPFAPFGTATISRALQPQLFEYLYSLSRSDGADPTRASDTGNDPLRHGEPDGELGLVTQKDPAWQDQSGAPADPQPGNIPGGPRDTLRGADFNDGKAAGFVPDVGNWLVSSGRYSVSPATSGGDAVSVFYVDSLLPRYFEVRAHLNVAKPLSGAKANGYLLFDYQSPTSFKFAGLDLSRNKLQIGVRNASGWQILVERPSQLKTNTDHAVTLIINGSAAQLTAGNDSISYTFPPRIDAEGLAHTLNGGMLGLGAQNATGSIDNVLVQVLPPILSTQLTETFNTGSAGRFGPNANWTVSSGRYVGTPTSTTASAQSLMNLNLPRGLSPNAALELRSTLKVTSFGGIVFDAYANDDFKFVALLPDADQIVIGHRSPRQGWVHDAVVSRVLSSDVDYNATLTLVGTTISVSINGQSALSYAFNAPIVDGQFGVMSKVGTTSVDSFTFLTNDSSATTALNAPLAARSTTTPGVVQASRLDVNRDGLISPMDALLIINQLNASTDTHGEFELDVNQDSYLSPLDALLVINELQRTTQAVRLRAAQPAPWASLEASPISFWEYVEETDRRKRLEWDDPTWEDSTEMIAFDEREPSEHGELAAARSRSTRDEVFAKDDWL